MPYKMHLVSFYTGNFAAEISGYSEKILIHSFSKCLLSAYSELDVEISASEVFTSGCRLNSETGSLPGPLPMLSSSPFPQQFSCSLNRQSVPLFPTFFIRPHSSLWCLSLYWVLYWVNQLVSWFLLKHLVSSSSAPTLNTSQNTLWYMPVMKYVSFSDF